MLQQKTIKIWLLGGMFSILCGCQQDTLPKDVSVETQQQETFALSHLGVQPKAADIALPFCENKSCINIDIQSIEMNDTWMDQWLAHHHGVVVQDLIGLDQKMTLQQAIDAYVEKSDQWRSQATENVAYELHVASRIAALRQQYVLIKLNIHALQGKEKFENVEYFFVADRQQQRTVKLLDLIQPEQQLQMNAFIQVAYQNWLKEQEESIQQHAPEKLYWGQADWFFDGEGIGVHYRAGHVLAHAPILNIYLTQAQTQQVLKSDIYADLFE